MARWTASAKWAAGPALDGQRAVPLGLSLSEGLGITAQPLRARRFIQAVWPKWTSFRDARMLEVCICVFHADALHDRDRRCIHDRSKGHDLRDAEVREALPEARLGALRCITVTPAYAFQTPADLNAWAERHLPARNVQSDEANELSCTKEFYRPVSPALVMKVGKPRVNGRV